MATLCWFKKVKAKALALQYRPNTQAHAALYGVAISRARPFEILFHYAHFIH